MNPVGEFSACDRMLNNGGEFEVRLAKLFAVADSQNRQILLKAFPHIFEKWMNFGETV